MDNLDKNNPQPFELDDSALEAAAGGEVSFSTKYSPGDYIGFSPKYCGWCKKDHTGGWVASTYGTADLYCYIVRTSCGHLMNVYLEDL